MRLLSWNVLAGGGPRCDAIITRLQRYDADPIVFLGIFATGVAAAMVLIAAHSRPFSAAIAVRPTLLLQVMPEAGP